jgi:hypothetical protein
MANRRKTAKSSNFMEGVSSNQKTESSSIASIMDILDGHEVASQNTIVSEVLKRVKYNRQKSFEENQTKLASLQQDVSSFDQAVNAGLNAPYEPNTESA